MNPRISCRLPQTPRTPSSGMNHYFDDIFTRHVAGGANKSQKSPKPYHLRRTSTARSIGARSDFGDHEHDLDDEEQRDREGSVGPMDEQRLREREEADRHVANYVSEQLHRVRSHDSAWADNVGDEFEAQLDED